MVFNGLRVLAIIGQHRLLESDWRSGTLLQKPGSRQLVVILIPLRYRLGFVARAEVPLIKILVLEGPNWGSPLMETTTREGRSANYCRGTLFHNLAHFPFRHFGLV